jgi:putative transposase
MAYFSKEDNPQLAEKLLFKDKYYKKSTRLDNWDYTSCGYYYVTICTKDKKFSLGEVIESDKGLGATVNLLQAGELIDKCWNAIPDYYPNIELDMYTIMPNHMHGIIFIKEQIKDVTLGLVINQFKASCTKHIRKLGYNDFTWQPRFYDHIIRDDKDLDRIRKYITENPIKWLLGEGDDW